MSKQWKNDLKALYQQTRQELPPPELNQKIRQAALKAIQRKSPNLKWYLSSAAVVLLAVNVVLFIYLPEPEVIEIPEQRSTEPYNQMLPKTPVIQSNPAPIVDSEFDGIETKKLRQIGKLEQRDLQRNKSTAKKVQPELNDVFIDSLKTETEETGHALELYEASDSQKPSFDIKVPKNLPFDIHTLIAGHTNLTGRQFSDSLEINRNNKLILKMNRVQQGVLIEAYSEAQLWGVSAKWGLSAGGTSNCMQKEYLICDISNDIQGGFENNRLIFIRWIQKNEP
jgi:hypothetical protein